MYVRCARVQGRPVLWYLYCVPFSADVTLRVTSARRDFARTPDRAPGRTVGEVGGTQKPQGATTVTLHTVACVVRDVTSESCSRVVVYVRRARVQGRPVLWCLCCVPFSADGTLCVSLCQGATWRVLRPQGTVTHICPSALPSFPGAAQSGPELREVSPVRSGLAVRGVRSHRPSPWFLWPCHFSAP